MFGKHPIVGVMFMAVQSYIVFIHGLPAPNPTCKCVPDQWSGLLSSVERHYDLHEGHTATSDNTMFINYDYKNKMFTMEDLNSGSIAIADYNKGYKYLIRGEHCHAIETDEKMTQMCLPDTSVHKGDFVLGAESPVEIWEFEGPMNMNMRTTVLKDSCMPVAEEVAMNNEGFASLTSSFYFNVKFGVENKKLPPANCVYSSMQDVKRGDVDITDHENLNKMMGKFQQP